MRIQVNGKYIDVGEALTSHVEAELTEAIAKYSDRPVEAIIMHVAFDPLIIWAWQPGADRTPPPGTHQDFVALINEWIGTGAACPEN